MDSLTKKDFESVIERILNCLYEKDSFLIAGENSAAYSDKRLDKLHHVGERAIVFRFAQYLQKEINGDPRFADCVVDCEYNRHFYEVKQINGKAFYPDLIVHRRGTDNCNLLVMEFKTYWNKDTTDDEKKLKALTKQTGDYHYSFGVSVVIQKMREETKPKWFFDGQALPEENE